MMPRCFYLSTLWLLLLPLLVLSARAADIFPGKVWNDDAGHPINAHGGGLLWRDGVYYWYGESKVGKTFLPEVNRSWGGTRVVMSGVTCYSSTNLTRWHFEGVVLSPVPHTDLDPTRILERPKVIYNSTTRQYVMWMHIDSPDYKEAHCGVATGDRPTGPFHYLRSFRPDAGVWPVNVTAEDKTPGPQNFLARDFAGGQMARDMTLFQDTDGTAYVIYSSEENQTLHISRLSADYLTTSGQSARILPGHSMEAPAMFRHHGKYYLIMSGCSGWAPNSAHSAVAAQPFGPWTELGNPCRGTDAELTFHGQSTFVLNVPGHPEAILFLADRWNAWDLENSRYLWLPLEFSDDQRPVVPWRSRWNLDGWLAAGGTGGQ
jgi:hypothetical protein